MDPSKRLGFELNGTQVEERENEKESASRSILPPQNSPEVGNAENQSAPFLSGQDLPRACDLLMSVTVRAEANKPKIRKLATAATEELIQLASEEEALWLLDKEAGNYVLNETEYKKRFAPLDPTLAEILRMLKTEGPMEFPNFDDTFDKVFSGEFESVISLRSEASQETGIVFMNPLKLVHMFMDADQWSILFSDIVAKAKVLEVLSMAKQGNFDGALQVMTAEFQVPSPLVQTRESYFLRHCSRLPSNTWVVVDVSLESIFPNPATAFLRKPSGCVIQGMEDGYSKVKWIEHVEVDNKTVHHLFKPLVTSGFAFSAKRWIGTLTRQCDRVAAYMDEHVMTMKDGKRSLLKLADRMMRNFQAGISASAENNIWKPIPAAGAEDILVTTGSSMDDPATPHGVCVTVATTVWLPSHPTRVFEFLRNGDHRNKWDLLSLNCDTREIMRVASSREPANCVSVIGISTSQQIFYLQESQMNSTGSYIVYAPIDKFTLHPVLSGEKESPDDIQILSSGFAVLPDRAPTMQQQQVGEEICGSLLTIAFQIVDTYSSSPEYLPPKSVITLYTLISETASRIRNAVTQ